MDNKGFDKLFSEKLQETQSFEFDESGWEEVSGQLQSSGSGKRRFWGFPFLVVCCLLLGAISIYLATKLNTLKSDIEHLEQTVSNLNVKEDTTIKKKTIVLYDTVYQTITLNNHSNKTTSTKQTNNIKKIHSTSTKQTVNFKKAKTIRTNSKRPMESKLSYFNNEKTTPSSTSNEKQLASKLIEGERVDESDKIMDGQKITSLIEGASSFYDSLPMLDQLYPSFLPEDELKINLLDPDIVIATLNKNKVPYKRRFYLGTIIGWSLAEYSEDSMFNNLDSNLSKKTTWEYGVQVAYQFSPHLSIWSSVMYNQFKNDRAVDSLDNSSAYLDQHNISTNNLEQIDFTQNAINIRLGLNYEFFRYNQWHPYVGLSTQLETVLKERYETTYDLTYPAQPQRDIIEITQGLNENALGINSIIPAIGLKFSLFNNFNWHCEAWYQIELGDRTEKVFLPFGIRTGLSYEF